MTAHALARNLAQEFLMQFPLEVAQEIENLPGSQVLMFLSEQKADQAALLLSHISPYQAAELLKKLGPPRAAEILEKMESRDAAQVLSQWEEDVRAKFLPLLEESLRQEIQDLMSYRPTQAGYFMDPKVLTFPPESPAAEVMAKIRSIKNRRVFDIFVVDPEKKLTGVVSLENLLTVPGKTPLEKIMNPNPMVLRDLSSREEAIGIFHSQPILNLPVIDFEGRLLGVIHQSAVVHAVEREALSDLQTMVGAGSEERALSKAIFAVKKRLPWLHVNLATAFLAAAVVGLFENTIAKFTALAVLLPVVAGQSGNSGAQALAVTLRGLALREVRVSAWPRIAFKEARVGLINGCAVALTTGCGVYLWSRSWGLSLVIGMSMVISMVAAGLAGAVIPLTLTAFKQDPAQSSSIFLTTITDIVGFLSFLGLATILAGWL